MERQVLPQRPAISLTIVDYEPLSKTVVILTRSAVPAYNNSLSRLSLMTADIASTEGRGEEVHWILT